MSNRIAIIDQNKCQPKKCKKECISGCPPQTNGYKVIEIVDIENIGSNLHKNITDKKQIARIAENLCIGCNMCTKRCPFDAIKIVNLPEEKKENIVHRFSKNGFRLYKLPILKKNCVTGLIGENGIGKTTLVKILSGKLIPNFENFTVQNDTKTILKKYRGSVLFDYLKKLYEHKLTFAFKPQQLIGHDMSVKDYLKNNDISINDELIEALTIKRMMEMNMKTLSGGELQKLYCYVTLTQNVDVYIFDEPSNFLDIKQRMLITSRIKNLVNENRYVIIIEHDFAMLDYVADNVFILYGKPGAYGIVSNEYSISDSINVYMNGHLPNENVRFRAEEYNLKSSLELDNENADQINSIEYNLEYPGTIITHKNFKLNIGNDKIKLTSSIHVILGENGIGKTTFIKYLAKTLGVNISYKDQTLDITRFMKNEMYPTVDELFYTQIPISLKKLLSQWK